MKTNNIKQTLKDAAVVVGMIAAGALVWAAVIIFMYACDAAGIPM